MKVNVVILNWNRREHLECFLPSVVANTPDGVGVVVVDNGSTDGSPEYVEKSFAGVCVIRLADNFGYTGGYNRALLSGYFDDADFFILLNSDVETPPGWCKPLLEKMGSEPDLAALAPKILSYGDRSMFEYTGASGGFIDGLGYPFCRGRILSTVEADNGQYDDARDVFWASGACLMVRAVVFRQLGGFDDLFFAHMEEIDLCWRMQSAGWRVAVEPRSRVYHLGAGTLAAKNPYKIYLNFRNTLATLYKNLSERSLWPVLVMRMILDGCSSLVYLVSGRPALFRAVWRAHRDFRRMRPELKGKRKAIRSSRVKKTRYIYRGSILLRYLFGCRRFRNIV